GEIAGTVSMAATGTVATFVPNGNLPASTFFNVSVSTDAHDASGKALAPFSSSFESGTAAAGAAPVLEATSPSNGATGVAVNAPIRARFSEPIDAVTVTP